MRTLLVACLLAICTCAHAIGTVAHEGSTVVVTESGGGGQILSFSITTAAVDEIILVAVVSPSGNPVRSMDGRSAGSFDGWVRVDKNDDGRCCLSLWEGAALVAGTSTFSVHLRAPAAQWTIVADAYTGCLTRNPIDDVERVDCGSVALIWTGDIIPVRTGDLVAVYAANASPFSTLFTADPTYTQLASVLGSGSRLGITDQIANVAGTIGVELFPIITCRGATGPYNGAMLLVALRPGGT